MQKRRRASGLAFVIVLAALSAASAQDKPASSPVKGATLYDAEFAFNNTTYAGSMTLKVVKGVVTGSMAIETPTKVTGDVAGTLKGTKLSLDYPFVMTGEQPCNGRVVIDATMDAQTSTAQGTARATGCGDPADGTFSIKRATKK
jgi:hypothetical protein